MSNPTVKEMRKELSYVINHVEHLSIKDVRERYYKLIKQKDYAYRPINTSLNT